MSRTEKLLGKVMAGRSDGSFPFADLCRLLQDLGYTSRHRGGSHIIFQRGASFLNLQSDGSKAKSYQVRQVREELKKQNIGL